MAFDMNIIIMANEAVFRILPRIYPTFVHSFSRNTLHSRRYLRLHSIDKHFPGGHPLRDGNTARKYLGYWLCPEIG